VRRDCGQEECPNWSGDGNVCPCAIFDIPRRLRCSGCRELVRPEDDFTRDDAGRFWHIDCIEED